MLEKILVATDPSPASDRLISCLQGLRPFDAREAVLVHALGIRHLEDLKYELARLVEPRLAEQKAQLEASGFKGSMKQEPESHLWLQRREWRIRGQSAFFAEISSGISAPGQRVLDVLIEGALVVDDLDTFNEAGANGALIKAVPVTVSDGQLNIEFVHGIENPRRSAIEVVELY